MSAEPILGGFTAAGGFRSWAASHRGRRSHNEDSYVNRPDLGLWAVADGAGGHQAGDVASRTVTDALAALPRGLGAAELLAEARLRIAEAHEALQLQAMRLGPEALMITTLVVLLARHDHFACLWAGDSRAYLLRQGRLRQLTHDHSLVQELLDRGEITAAEARHHPDANIITRALGGDEETIELDKVSDRLRRGDRFLLCSDGLYKTVPEGDLVGLLADDSLSAERLVAAALERQADDNVTAMIIEADAEEANAGPPPPHREGDRMGF
ncbi:MAG TPA: protein phosphatase 2C domain-containing protein [Stellaceae bacterium]|jgi:protein phosphatase/serine/threonine-protein phosphatase Stp1